MEGQTCVLFTKKTSKFLEKRTTPIIQDARVLGQWRRKKRTEYVEDSYEETCTWVTTDQPVAIMDQWIQCIHSQEIFHLTDQVKNQTKLHGKEIPEARKLSGCILLAPIFMRNRDCRTGYLQNSLLENFHFEEFCDWIQLWWSSVNQLFEVIAVCVN